jgi:hypothetical protein
MLQYKGQHGKISDASRGKARIRSAKTKPTTKDESAKIVGVASANGCPEFGRLWVQRFGADFASFKRPLPGNWITIGSF